MPGVGEIVGVRVGVRVDVLVIVGVSVIVGVTVAVDIGGVTGVGVLQVLELASQTWPIISVQGAEHGAPGAMLPHTGTGHWQQRSCVGVIVGVRDCVGVDVIVGVPDRVGEVVGVRVGVKVLVGVGEIGGLSAQPVAHVCCVL